MVTSRQLDKDILARLEPARRLASRSVTLKGETICEVRQIREEGCTFDDRIDGEDEGYGGVYKLAEMLVDEGEGGGS